MKQFTMVFKTKHRKYDAVKEDLNSIIDCIGKFTKQYKYTFVGKYFIFFYVYGAEKDNRYNILCTILGNIQCSAKYKSLDLEYYTNE